MQVIEEIREQWARRQNWHRAEKSLTLQAKALCRRLVGGDKGEAEKLYSAATKGKDHPLADTAMAAMMPLLEAKDSLAKQRKQVEKRLAKLAEEVPGYHFVTETKGFGALGFSGIIGEAGNPADYRNRSCFQKRMGLAVINGGRQRRVSGVDAIVHGYDATRRSLVWTLGDSLIKGAGKDSKYRQYYDNRKAYELDRSPEMTKAHAHNRAKRYMESKLLRDLYYACKA